MNKIKVTNPNAVYHSIPETAYITGLPPSFLRNELKAGRIKHIMSGKKYLINVPALLAQLEGGTQDRE